MERVGVGACHASFGELLQGVLPGGHKFLVNCRIRNQSRVTVQLSDPGYSSDKEKQFARSYVQFPKTYKGLRIFLGDLGRHDDCLVSVESDIPVGKGLSSSTADMVAGVRALSQALSVKLKKDYISRVLSDVEPNDGLHFDATSAYCHTEGRLLANVPWVPPFRILGVDQGGKLDTVAFNQRAIIWSQAQMARYRELLDAMTAALETHDTSRIAALASDSTRAWQKINPKADFASVFELAGTLGAQGVINTHSGTYLGLLFADDPGLDQERLSARVAERLPSRDVAWFLTTGCQTTVQSHVHERELLG